MSGSEICDNITILSNDFYSFQYNYVLPLKNEGLFFYLEL